MSDTDEAVVNERNRIVRLLAGEWGEMEVGPTDSVDDLVSHIHDTAKVTMLHVTKILDLKAKLAVGLDERNEARQAATELRDLCRSEGLETNPVDEPFTLPWEADSR